MKTTFQVSYRITLLKGEHINKKIQGVCLEQSVEMPADVLPLEIQKNVVGKPVSVEEIDSNTYEVDIEWPLANVGDEITQFVNVIFGNISLKPGITVTSLDWKKLDHLFQGPEFGIHRIRQMWGIHGRALSGTALKPLGFSPQQLGELCYEFAVGGIDIIKDDHGLANQTYAPFRDRVTACVEAIKTAANETGNRSYYFPNITSSPAKTINNYKIAAELGADGVLFAPQLTGLDTLHDLAGMEIDLPIMAHPSFSGNYVIHKSHGFTPAFYYGEFWRALGADFVIYPNTDGRFSLTAEDCQHINNAARDDMATFRPTFPTPGGGINRNKIKKWLSLYGNDTVMLIGGSLYQHPLGVRKASREIRTELEQSELDHSHEKK